MLHAALGLSENTARPPFWVLANRKCLCSCGAHDRKEFERFDVQLPFVDIGVSSIINSERSLQLPFVDIGVSSIINSEFPPHVGPSHTF